MTSPSRPSAATAGWYADPSGLPALRWWDGQEWTAHVQPGVGGAPPTTISAGWRGGPATKPVGEPRPGAHTVDAATTSPGAAMAASGEPLPGTQPSGDPRSAATDLFESPGGYPPSTAFLTQPVDSVSEQLGYTTPATAAAKTGPSPGRAVVVGAVSLVINPLLLCSIYAIVMGLRIGVAGRGRGTLAVALGVGGIVTHVALVALLITLL